jgi:hypothetical protein
MKILKIEIIKEEEDLTAERGPILEAKKEIRKKFWINLTKKEVL